MITKRLMAVVVMLVFLITTMAACGGNGSVEKTASPQAPQQAATPEKTAETAAVDDKSPITFDAIWCYANFDKVWGDDPASKKITELTGVTLNLRGITGESNEKANLMLASGDYPEIMWMDRNAILQKYISAGVLNPIDELAAKNNCSNLVGKYIPESCVKNLKSSDGHLYVMPNWFSEKGEQGVGDTVNIRKDIYEKLGSPALSTLDDLYNYMVKIRDANIKFNNQKVWPVVFNGKAADVATLANLWGSKIRSYRYFDENEQKVKFFLRNNSVLEASKFFNKLYREKLLDPNIFTIRDSGDELEKSVAGGKYAISLNSCFNLWNQVNVPLRVIDPNAYFVAVEPPVAASGVTPYLGSYSTVGWNVSVITKNCKNPDRAIKFFDFFLGPEGQSISYCGIEGVNWDKGADGMPVLRPGEFEKLQADWAGYSKKSGVWYIGSLNQNQKYNPEIQNEKGQNKADRNIAEAHAFDGTALDILTIEAETDAGKAMANILLSIDDDIVKVILAKTEEDCVKMYDQMLKKYESFGLAKVEEAWTTQYVERLKY